MISTSIGFPLFDLFFVKSYMGPVNTRPLLVNAGNFVGDGEACSGRILRSKEGAIHDRHA